MAHKTFISYKYSEAQDLRDRIIEALGDDAKYYSGETSDSPDLTDLTTETIKKKLSDMMYDTSVTILIVSPQMNQSEWIPWEIEYSLKKISRKGRTSRTNGIVGVVMKHNGSYDWFISHGVNCHGSSVVYYQMDLLPEIASSNCFNSNPRQWHCNQCKTFDFLNGSYIALVEEEDFIANPTRYIDNAYDKSENDGEGYDLSRTR